MAVCDVTSAASVALHSIESILCRAIDTCWHCAVQLSVSASDCLTCNCCAAPLVTTVHMSVGCIQCYAAVVQLCVLAVVTGGRVATDSYS